MTFLPPRPASTTSSTSCARRPYRAIASRSTSISRYGLPCTRRARRRSRPGPADDPFDLESHLLQGVEIVARILRRIARGCRCRSSGCGFRSAEGIRAHSRERSSAPPSFRRSAFPASCRCATVFGLEHDRCLDHFDRRRVGGGFGPAELSRRGGDLVELSITRSCQAMIRFTSVSEVPAQEPA